MFCADRLEARRLLCWDHAGVQNGSDSETAPGSPPPADAGKWDFAAATGGPEANVPLSELPLLDSNPGAPVNLILDFDGRFVSSWSSGTPGQQPAYTLDSDANTYSPQELTNISEIWRRVSEKYSPFRINVTTRDAGTITARQDYVVMISGNGSWYGNAGGVAFVNGFQSGGNSGIAWVFPAQNPSNLQFIAEASAHESGHGFGLYHQSAYSGGSLQQEYNPGDSLRAPILGNSYSTRRGLWWVGPSSSFGGGTQQDLDVLTRAQNNFGYRTDDAGGTVPAAASLPINGFNSTGGGILTTTADVDLYSFEAGAGFVTFTVSGPVALTGSNIGMIDPSVAILDQLGSLLVSSVHANANETISFNVTTPGLYHLRISSHGNVGDIGQYRFAGTVPSANLPSAPSLPDLAESSDRGFSQSDELTNDTTPTFAGAAQPGSTVRLYENLALVGTALTNATGDWEITTPPLADGQHQFTATAEDARGTSQFSQVATVTIETVAPIAGFASFEYQQSQALQFTFNEPVAGSISPTTLELLSVPSLQPVSATFAVSAAGNTVILTGSPLLPNGNFRAAFPVGSVTDAAGNAAVGVPTVDFFALAGDANRDRAVALNDFTLLVSNFSKLNRSFSQGDFNYDDVVNLDDFTILAANFGRSVPVPADLPRAALAAAQPGGGLFSTQPVERDRVIDLIQPLPV